MPFLKRLSIAIFYSVFIAGPLLAEEPVNPLTRWKEIEYKKRFDEKISQGLIKPDIPKDLVGKKLDLQFYQAGYIRGILAHRSLEGLGNSVAYYSVRPAESGLFRQEFDGYLAGSRAAAKLGEEVKKKLEKQMKYWLTTDTLPPNLRMKK